MTELRIVHVSDSQGNRSIGDDSSYAHAPLGEIEPHASLLSAPSDDELLYKVMTVDNLLRSVDGGYLHFNRVDGYGDFDGGDAHDGEQLAADHQGNADAKFAKAPQFSAADYYDRSRARTYACCFSLEGSESISRKLMCGDRVCVAFQFGKLRERINKTLRPGNAAVMCRGTRCDQIFSVNYGIVEYVDWDTYQANAVCRANPIRYTYLKDKKRFADEKEVRISLSAFGLGHFMLIITLARCSSSSRACRCSSM